MRYSCQSLTTVSINILSVWLFNLLPYGYVVVQVPQAVLQVSIQPRIDLLVQGQHYYRYKHCLVLGYHLGDVQVLEIWSHLQVILSLALELLRKLLIYSDCPGFRHFVLLNVAPKITTVKECSQYFALLIKIQLVFHVCRNVVEVIQHHFVILVIGCQYALH